MNQNDDRDVSKRARETALHLLRYRPRSEYELRQKLQAKAYPDTVIDQTICHLKETTLLDDKKFAAEWTSCRIKRPFGLNRIRLELTQKGIAEETIDEVLTQASHDYNEMDAAQRLARRRADKTHDVPRDKLKQRIYGYLSRRGFKARAIRKAIENL